MNKKKKKKKKMNENKKQFCKALNKVLSIMGAMLAIKYTL